MLAFPFGKVVENSLNYEIEDFFSSCQSRYFTGCRLFPGQSVQSEVK